MSGDTCPIKAPKESSKKFVATLRGKFLRILTRGSLLRILSFVLRSFLGGRLHRNLVATQSRSERRCGGGAKRMSAGVGGGEDGKFLGGGRNSYQSQVPPVVLRMS